MNDRQSWVFQYLIPALCVAILIFAVMVFLERFGIHLPNYNR
ncbi:hypothetical protein [Spirosoma fluminis]